MSQVPIAALSEAMPKDKDGMLLACGTETCFPAANPAAR
ncbi:hypothetical protein C8K44_103223 [Aminobacter sp. AP02]|nr:hypothetical protein C8K44_103223 [Aminobacter sp. AP02]